MPIDRQRNQTLFRRMSRLLKKVTDKPQPDAVHHLRTTARRIEALLEALAPEPGRNERKLQRLLRRIRRRAGSVRDLDVQIALLRGLKIGRDSQRKSRLLEDLSDLRAKRERKLVDALGRQTVSDVRKRLRKTAEDLGLFVEPTPGGARDSAPPVNPVVTSLRMFSRIAREQGALREANLHAYRVQTKHARYVAEMAGKEKTAQAIVAELKRMQDAVGEWHDWLELGERAQQSLKAVPESPMLSALDNITRAKLREAVAVCTEVRKTVLDMAAQVAPPRKVAVGAGDSELAASA